MDWDSFMTIKLNSEFSFPMLLNLEPFTKEGLARQREIDECDESYYQSCPEANYFYELEAVLVHSGITAEQGHYFAYARNKNDEWYEMNDSMTRPWDPKARLAVDCFGGANNGKASYNNNESGYWSTEVVSYGPCEQYSGRDNPQSAYMLSYRRRNCLDKFDDNDKEVVPQKLLESIEEDNTRLSRAHLLRSPEFTKCIAILLDDGIVCREFAEWSLDWCINCLGRGQPSPASTVHFTRIIENITEVLVNEDEAAIIMGNILDKHIVYYEAENEQERVSKFLFWKLLLGAPDSSIRD
eukprot:CAMPEP_0171480796 /NCGR_PEP_ID=MMETSP0946-20130122/6309_1 /TAXON_ID=109269 /ORGANISM="Vaucheria litorea, Strain CCMP2940" /LENGTH=296 /DNA_ID=CAMNT_0012012137 /DNA_START=129 /DNA_END=1016 /DNA_ORIENTATION=-